MLVVHCPRCGGLKHLSGHKAEADDYIGARRRCDCPPEPAAPQPHGPPHPDAKLAVPRRLGLFDAEGGGPILTPIPKERLPREFGGDRVVDWGTDAIPTMPTDWPSVFRAASTFSPGPPRASLPPLLFPRDPPPTWPCRPYGPPRRRRRPW